MRKREGMKSVESTLEVVKAKQGKKIDILIKAMVDFENKCLFQGKEYALQ